MNINKRIEVFLLGLISAVFTLPLASAQFFYDSSNIRYSIEQGINVFINFFAPFFEAIIGDYSRNEFFLAKVLFMIMLFVVVRLVSQKIPAFEKQKGVATVIAIVVSILGVRYIPEDSLIAGLILPYTTLAIAILVGLVFLIYFFAVFKSGMLGLGRRLAWIFFGIVFAVLWFDRADQISPIANQIYGWTLVAIVLVLIFDRKIKVYFSTWELKGFEKHISNREILTLYGELETAERHGHTPEGKSEVKRIKERLRELKKGED